MTDEEMKAVEVLRAHGWIVSDDNLAAFRRGGPQGTSWIFSAKQMLLAAEYYREALIAKGWTPPVTQ